MKINYDLVEACQAVVVGVSVMAIAPAAVFFTSMNAMVI